MKKANALTILIVSEGINFNNDSEAWFLDHVRHPTWNCVGAD
jgi:hypothetical protein